MHPPAVTMDGVGAVAVAVLFLEQEVSGLHQRHAAGQELGNLRVRAEVFVGIGHIAGRGNDHRDPGGWSARRGTHKEGNVVFTAGRVLPAQTQPGSVHSTFQAFGNRKLEISLPAGVVYGVVMKMNRPVLLWRGSKTHMIRGPVVTGHATRRHIDAVAVQAVQGIVQHLGRGSVRNDIGRKIPGCDQCRSQLGREGPRTLQDTFDFRPVEYAIGDSRAFYPSVKLGFVLRNLDGRVHMAEMPATDVSP